MLDTLTTAYLEYPILAVLLWVALRLNVVEKRLNMLDARHERVEKLLNIPVNMLLENGRVELSTPKTDSLML